MQLSFIGAPHGLEQRLVPQHGYPLVTISARPFPRRLFSPGSVLAGAVMLYGVAQALRYFHRWRPQVVIGTGGYASVCALLAGKLAHAITVLFEANTIPGRTNKLLARLADWIATGFPETVRFFPKGKAEYTGVPIRPEFQRVDRTKARQQTGLSENEVCLLVMGGSRGARRINEALWDALPRLLLLPSLRIWHLCGTQWEGEAQRLRAALPAELQLRYQPFGYREDMPQLLHAADLALSRAGASTIAELLTAGVPSILVPYPFAIYDHQRFNALSVVRRGAGVMVLNDELTGERLSNEVQALLSDPERLNRMRQAALRLAQPKAAETMVARILERLRQR